MLVGLLADKGHLLINQLETALGQWPLVRFENEVQAQSEVRALMTSMIHAWTQPDAIAFTILFNHWHPGSSHGDLFLRGPEEAHGSQDGQIEGHNIVEPIALKGMGSGKVIPSRTLFGLFFRHRLRPGRTGTKSSQRGSPGKGCLDPVSGPGALE